jgi:hypothetical protein
MPYIAEARKQKLDVGRTTHWIPPNVPIDAGELTYCLQQELKRFLGNRPGGYHYADLAVALGALEGTKADFIDRVLLPYEHDKREQNGDVWEGL